MRKENCIKLKTRKNKPRLKNELDISELKILIKHAQLYKMIYVI